MSKRTKAIESLIRKYLEKGYLPQAVSASSLRDLPGLTENEKYLLIKKIILNSWESFSEADIKTKKVLENTVNVTVYKNIDNLIDFAINNVKNIGFITIVNILEAFGSSPDNIFRLLILLKENNRGSLYEALQIIRSDGTPMQAIDYVVKWAIEDDSVKTAIKASDLRCPPGLTPIELETLLKECKKNGNIVDSIILADMREPEAPGLTTAEIEEIAAAIKT